MSQINFPQVAHHLALDESLCTASSTTSSAEKWRCGLFVRVCGVGSLSSLSWDGKIVGVYDSILAFNYDVDPTDEGIRGRFPKDVLSILDPVSTITDTALTEDVLIR